MAEQAQINDGAEVAAALESFVALLEGPDPQARAFIYTEDATFAMPGILVEGRRAMLERLESGTVLESVTLTPHVIERRDDLGYAYGASAVPIAAGRSRCASSWCYARSQTGNGASRESSSRTRFRPAPSTSAALQVLSAGPEGSKTPS